MQSSVQNLEALKRELTVTVPAVEVQVVYDKRLNEVAKTAKINGFRPGKVPTHIIDQRFGKGILEEIAGNLIQTHFEKAIQENQLRVAGMPSVTKVSIKKNEPFEFTAVFEVYPEIAIQLLSGATIEREQAVITDQDLADMLVKIQKQHAEFEVVERAAQNGDRVMIDFDGSINGEAFQGGAAKQQVLELGSKSMIPGFEEGIVGMSVGETKDVEVTFPSDYHSEDLKGKLAVFKIMLHKIEEPKLPEIDEKLANKMQIDGGVDALKSKVREGMERELKEQLKARLKEQVLDKLLAINSLEVPVALITAETQHLKKMSLQRMANQYHMPLEKLEKLNFPDEPYKQQAEKRVRLGLLLAEVIQKYSITPNPEAVKERVKEMASYYQDPAEVEQWYFNNKEALSEVEAAVIEDAAVEKLMSEAIVTEKNLSYSDIVSK